MWEEQFEGMAGHYTTWFAWFGHATDDCVTCEANDTVHNILVLFTF